MDEGDHPAFHDPHPRLEFLAGRQPCDQIFEF